MLPYPLKIPLREGVFQPNLAYPALARLSHLGPHLAYGFFRFPWHSKICHCGYNINKVFSNLQASVNSPT